MIKYRLSQKEFIAPALIGMGGKLMNAAFAGSSVMGIFQGKKSNQLMAEQNAEMERANREQQKIEQQRVEQEKKWQEQQYKLQKKALKQGVNPFGQVLNPQGQPTQPVQMPQQAQMNYSDPNQRDSRLYSFTRDMALLASRNSGRLMNGVLAGAAATAGVYSIDRAIRKDKKRREIEENYKDYNDQDDCSRSHESCSFKREKSYSKRNRRRSLKSPIFSFMVGAAGPAISYATERKLEKDLMKDTISSPSFREKSFASVLSPTGKVLNTVSILAGGGGAKGMRKLGIQISAIGKKSGNKATKKLGKAILNNPNASMALSIPGGIAIMGGTYALGDKVATKIAKKLDPEAFKYVESKEEEVD